MNSIILVDKPSDITSFDVIRILRKKLNIKKIGHAGVLDKMATGLLVCATNRATKLLSIFENSYKIYLAEIMFGVETDTYDISGKILRKSNVSINRGKIKEIVSKFVGVIEQKPPPFSNVKYKGKRLYEYALKRECVNVKPRKVEIYGIELIDVYLNRITLEIKCSKGTYIRSLAHDLGKLLGCGAVVSNLRRTYVYPFSVNEASSPFEPKIFSLKEALRFLNEIVVNDEYVTLIRNGVLPCRFINCFSLSEAMYKITDVSGNVIAVIEKVNNFYSYKAIFI